MEAEHQELLATRIGTLLDQSRQALRVGNATNCREAAMLALQVAQESKDPHKEALAHLCLANADRMLSRTRRAHDSSQRAAFLFQLCGDKSGEAEALSTLAYTFSVLGRNEEAVEAALLSVKLNEHSATFGALANSYTYLGIAHSHCGGYRDADAAFSRAIEMLEGDASKADAFFPRMHQRLMLTTQVTYDRYFSGQLPSLEGLRQLREAHLPTADFVQSMVTLQGAHSGNQVVMFLLFLNALESCWVGDLNTATSDLAKATEKALEFEDNPLYRIVAHWVRAELAWAKNDWLHAQQNASKMVELAIQVESEQFVAIGYLLSSQLFTLQGMHLQAQEQQKLLRRRERLLRNEAIKSRAATVEWQLKVRASYESLQQMESETKRLEKLSFEDALTSIPNRRKFEQYLPEMLRKGNERGMQPYVVFIDIDRFKAINDRFSHRVGDEVLKRIATILKSFVREGDLSARLAGDEFVIAFEGGDALLIEQINKRINMAVACFDWTSVCHGLSVTVSMGVSRAQVGDTVESLVHRSDQAMYLEKASNSLRV